ncbi:CYTH domain-containing protein [Ruminiclostridium sufflavum DSM 19573]|uniref:CYTH domain-containing protein n=1 Tax=Ruminiclostridium sufflavum DSM 19573 TaxID=1121337 RepID=A0A318XNP6_9FIRM|nr:CYTH domain-containing protein [Ruminiclostridium sufflavum]PYG89775.1 CYTH domain-containing protein [Ruminiclostridium sufflavum DSM 19573]
MATEIEKKFLVTSDKFKRTKNKALFRQGYLSIDFERTVRVRSYDGQGFLTIKGKTRSCTREEFEYNIPVHEAERMLDKLCVRPIIEKIRYFLTYEGCKWIVDEFLGVNEGLITAEIELENEAQIFAKPEWVGNEITYDIRYFNSNLVENPYKSW